MKAVFLILETTVALFMLQNFPSYNHPFFSLFVDCVRCTHARCESYFPQRDNVCECRTTEQGFTATRREEKSTGTLPFENLPPPAPQRDHRSNTSSHTPGA